MTGNSLEQGLPASPEAERAILGSVFSDPSLCDEAAQYLAPGDFSSTANRIIFTVMRDMREHSVPIDEISLSEELSRRGQLDAVGERSYLSTLSDGVVVRDSNEHLIKAVRDRAARRAVIKASQDAMGRAVTGADFEDALGNLENDLAAIRAHSTDGPESSFASMVWNVLSAIEGEANTPPGQLLGLTTTIDSLDKITTGFRKGEVWTLGAFPGRGKTAFAKQVAAGNARNGVPVKVFTIEMGEDPFLRRILAAEADVPNFKLRNPPLLSKVERERTRGACSAIAEWPLHIDPTASLTCGELLARARMSIARDGAKLIIVDHLGLVDGPGADNTKRLEGVSKAIRAFAKHTKVPVLQLSHLSLPKDKEINRRPTMLDLKYSGDIAGHSHVVLLLYVPEGSDGEPTGYDEIVAGKVREGCPGILPVRFNPMRMEYQVRTA